jgi:hypothetical protein
VVDQLGDERVCVLERGVVEVTDDAHVLADCDEPIAYHSHCQQRTLGVEVYTKAVFDDLASTT